MSARAHWMGIGVTLCAAALLLRARGSQGQEIPAPTFPAPPPVVGPLPTLSPAVRPATPASDLPVDAIGLAALTYAAQTTIFTLRDAGAPEPLAGPTVLDERSLSVRGDTLAYLVLPGPDPSEDFIEVHGLARGDGWQVRPDGGRLIFGFALASDGTRLAYLDADARVVGTRVPWRVVSVDLATGSKSVIVDDRDGGFSLLPLAWTRETIIFRGLTPFTAQHHGLWVARPDGSDLRQIAAEADFVGLPLLSPAGDRLALLVADPAHLPAGYGPGEPPPNAIRVVDLRSGQSTLIAPPEAGQGWTGAEWTPEGLAAMMTAWDSESLAFVPRSLLAFDLQAGGPPALRFSAGEGELTHWAACPGGGWLAALRSGDRIQIVGSRAAEPVAAFEAFEGRAIDWLVCIEANEGLR